MFFCSSIFKLKKIFAGLIIIGKKRKIETCYPIEGLDRPGSNRERASSNELLESIF